MANKRKQYTSPWQHSVNKAESLRLTIATQLAACEQNFSKLPADEKYSAAQEISRLTGALETVNYVLKHILTA